ncbi:MAG: FHA domain-containing protein [Armatimonadota bacterium]
MEDETQSVGEATVVTAPKACPVCGTSNPPGEAWCSECGFRLDAVPGEAPPLQAAEPSLRLVSQRDGRQYALARGTHLVGRSDEAQVLIDHPSVSRRHAMLTVDEDSVLVEDLGSTNGTRVDGRLLKPNEPVRLTCRARIAFAEEELVLEGLPEQQAAQAESPVEVEGPVLLGEDGKVVSLRNGVNTIGRREGNDIVIPDPYVSSRHAEISLQEGTVTLTDKASTNGTLVNGERIEPNTPKELHDGDTVTFARVSFRFLQKPPGADAREQGE